MSWLRIDDAFSSHPKVLALGSDQRRWTWLKVLTYTCRYRSPIVPPNIAEDVPKADKKFLESCLNLGLLDRQKDGALQVHDWHEYQAGDPKKALRQAKWRKHVDADVDAPVDADVDGDVDASRVGAPARPVPSRPKPALDLPALDSKAGLDFDSARESLPPSQTLQERDPQDAPGVLLDALTDADQGTETILRNFRLPEYAYRQALEEVTQRGRSAKLAVTILKRIADEQANPPDLTEPTRTNVQPANSEAAIRTMITNGSMTDPIHLEAELQAANLNGTTADQLRALLPDPVTASPDDDLPY